VAEANGGGWAARDGDSADGESERLQGRIGMYPLIRHELSKETKAKRGEVAEAKAENR
jgi:hypothetical protein